MHRSSIAPLAQIREREQIQFLEIGFRSKLPCKEARLDVRILVVSTGKPRVSQERAWALLVPELSFAGFLQRI